MSRLMVLAVMVLGLARCSGAPDVTRFYVLAPTDGASAAANPATGGRDLRVGIRSVELPRYLDRPQIVTRASANRLELAEFHQWGAPLRSAVPGLLAENLGRLLPSEQVHVFPWGRGFTPDVQVLVEVSRLDGSLAGDSVLAARWRIVARGGDEVGGGTSRFTEPSGRDYDSLVAAHSRLVGSLSHDIAAALRRSAKVDDRGTARP
jgi:uncharacterized lipoprotein YmbA